MIKRNFLFLLLLLISPVFLIAQERKTGNAHLGLVYPLSTNGVHAGEYTNGFSLHGIAGVSWNETRFALYGIAGIIKDSAFGVQIAGLFNYTGNRADGVQIGGVLNRIKKDASGLQIAGFTNITGSFDGLQIAGFCNLSKESARGVQISGFLNTAGDADMQIAGFVNKAQKVRGVQIAGFINIADSSDYPVGILNFIRNGEKSVGVYIDETLTAMASFRSGGRVLYGILGLGYNLKSSKSLYGLEAGVGAHLLSSEYFRIDAEAATTTLADFKSGEYFKSSLHILPALRIGDRIMLSAGPAVDFVTYSKDKGAGLVDRYLWHETRRGHFHGMYLGVRGGIQVRL